MSGKEPKNLTASIQSRLKNISRQEKKSFDLILLLYFQERFLYRLSISPFSEKFIIKGGLLLFSMTDFQTRPTKDIDFLAHHISNDTEQLKAAVQQMCRIPCPDDSVLFDEDSVDSEPITETAEYGGVRIRVTAFLGNIRKQLQLDIGFGDVVIPKPQVIQYPVLLDMGIPTIQAYSLESVIAEKFEAMVTLSVVNSRMKDFYDIYTLLNSYDFDGRILQESVYETFSKRGTIVERHHVIFTDLFVKDHARIAQWNAFLNRTGLESVSFETVICEIIKFLKPIYDTLLDEAEFFQTWNSSTKEWIDY